MNEADVTAAVHIRLVLNEATAASGVRELISP